MPDFFCISVTFHNARFHGQADGGAPEWPPSPLRVYQALVAACAACGSIDQFRSALLWLEEQSEPTIVAPAVFQPRPYRIAVPNNDLDVPARYWARGEEAPKYKGPQDLKSMKTICPTHLEDGDTLHFLYPLPTPLAPDIRAHTNLLGSAARSITHLGWGVDMVCAHGSVISAGEAARLPGRRWKAVNHSTTRLRAPQSGTLDALIQRHHSFLHRVSDDGFMPVPPLRGFRNVSYDDVDRINCRPFAAFDLVPADPADRRPRRPFRQDEAVAIAAMVRHAACEAAKNDLVGWRTGQWAQRFVAGHGPHDAQESFARFSYIPLPTIPTSGVTHGDGMIRRVIIAETCDGDGQSASWAARRLAGVALHRETDDAEVAILKPVQPRSDPVFRAYCDPADRWQTVTPVILPGFDDNSRSKRLRLLLRCVEQVGISPHVIADLDVQTSPWLRASTQTRAYKRSARLQHLPACHVRVYFKRPVAGPLVLGAGRHRGLGVLAVCP